MATKDHDSPDYQSPAYAEMEVRRTLVRDIYEGTEAVRRKAATYLPKAPAETDQEWQRRIRRSELFNGLAKTHRGLTGMVFRRNPQLGDDVPPVLADHAEDIDLQGTHLDVFARRAFDDAMLDGHCGILVDYQAVPNPDQLSRADEQERQLRPYWVKIRASQILSWREAVLGGKRTLMQVAIREDITEPSGSFGEVAVCQVRVFRRDIDQAGTSRIVWELYREVKVSGELSFELQDYGEVRGPTEIPLVIIYGGETKAPLVSRPPLLDLAYTNVAHYQVQSDHRHSLHIASVPLLIFKGRDKTNGAQVVGPNVGIDVDKDGDVKYAEHTGSALGQTRQELKDLEGRMAAQGLSMLQSESRAAETAEAKRLDKSEQDSALAVAARSLQDALEQAFRFHAQYLRLEPGSVSVNQEFEHLTLDAPTITAYSMLEQAGQIDLDTLWSMLKDGNVLPDAFDPAEVRLKIADRLAADRVTLPPPPGTPPATTPPVPPAGDPAAVPPPAA